MARPLDPLRAELDQRVRITGRTVAREWERDLQNTSPVDTGNMRDKTSARDSQTTNGVRVEAVVDTEYAEMVSSGTRPHEIRPRTARALRFQVGGQTVFAMKVNHPGTQPRDWWDESIRRLPDLVQRVWRGLR